MTNREWLSRRLPLRVPVLVVVVPLGVAALLLFLVDSMAVLLAVSPLAIRGLHTLTYADDKWRRRSDERRGRQRIDQRGTA